MSVATDSGWALVQIGDSATSASTFTDLEGQDGCTYAFGSTPADNSDKLSNWETTQGSKRTLQVSCSGKVHETRTNLEKLRSVWKTLAPHDCQILMDEAGNGWKGSFNINDFNWSAPDKGVVTYSFTLSPAAALTEVTPA